MDRELSIEQMIAELGDGHRHTFKVDGQDAEMDWQAVNRNVQLAGGAHAKMFEANKAQQAMRDAREVGRSDPGRYLEEHLIDMEKYPGGAKDFYMSQLKAQHEEHKAIEELRMQNPGAADERVRANERKRYQGIQDAKQAQAQRVAQQKQAAQQKRAFQESIPQALEAAGLPHNASTHAHLGAVMRHYNEVGHKLSVADAAHMAAENYHREIFERVNAMPMETRMKMFGDDGRKAMRAYELEQVKGKPAGDGKPKEEPATRPGGGAKPRQRLRDVSR